MSAEGLSLLALMLIVLMMTVLAEWAKHIMIGLRRHPGHLSNGTESFAQEKLHCGCSSDISLRESKSEVFSSDLNSIPQVGRKPKCSPHAVALSLSPIAGCIKIIKCLGAKKRRH